MTMRDPGWTANQLKRLGVSIRDEDQSRSPKLTYHDVLLWYNEWAVEVQSKIAAHDWSALLAGRAVEVTSRPKTLDTLRQKLQRDRATPLPRIQDVAGVRFEAEMSLDDQDKVATEICRILGQPSDAIRDLRVTPHSGYRAVHVWVRSPWRAEVQVRTHLQGEWANMYESAADFFGRSIRYDTLPPREEDARLVRGLRTVSTDRIVRIERLRNEAERLKRENVNALRELDFHDPEDTLPTHIAEAMDVRADIDERLDRAQSAESEMRSTLVNLKSIFDSIKERKG